MAKRSKATAAKQLPRRYHRANDAEVLDNTPIELPAGYRTPLGLDEMIARAVANELSLKQDDDPETWDEANDFEVPDDELLDFSPYTLKEVVEVDPVTSQMDPETADAFREFLKSRENASEAPESANSEKAASRPPEPNGPSEAVGSS